MSLSWIIYFANIISNLHQLAACVTIFSILFIVGLIGYALIEQEEVLIGPIKKVVTVLAVAILFVIVLPDRQTILTIVAAQYAENIAKSEKVQTVVDPAIDLLKAWIVEETNHLKKGG